MRRGLVALSVSLVLTAFVPATAGGAVPPAARPSLGPPIDIRELPTDYKLPRLKQAAAEVRRAIATYDPRRAPEEGDTKLFLAIDDFTQELYVKEYTYCGRGRHIEVWVASDSDDTSTDTMFPDGDCRNDPEPSGNRVEITDDQVNGLINDFDDNIYPKESNVFSVPPDRDGSNSIAEVIGLPADYWSGEGDNIVTLVDNVRDDNFYDTDNENEFSYIAGFFFSTFNEILDRNVMTIDAYDWLHRTGANPPDDPAPGDPCASAPARPYLYEGVFAHEYQHLLEYYEDVDEVNWVNEGLSDWAQTLTNYVDPSEPITSADFDGHIQCFLGWLGVQTSANPNPRDGGPENSLTLWGDQDADHEHEILCDYGAAYTLMEYLHDHHGGNQFMTDFHRDDLNGFESLDSLTGGKASKILHRWAAMVALDGVLDSGAELNGGKAKHYKTKTLNATINWDTPETYDWPGAPPNGSDYVRLRNASGDYLKAKQINKIKFKGDKIIPPLPVEWVVDPNPPEHVGDPALYSGMGDNLDRAIVREVTVPADNATLTFEHRYETEELWDFAFVQVSTDNGETYTSLANENTTEEHDPGAIPQIVENVPGFTGDSGGWVTETFDLSEYAGQTIHLSFRYITDSSVTLPGW